jgi:xanthine/CO dehydrogenase XdhC/CoxF family maturation factor
MESAKSDDVLEQAGRWLDEGRTVALATVVATWGSSPRPVGSQLVVDTEGNMLGSVSGGCIEGAVVGEAMQTMAGGEPKLLEYGVTDEMAWEVGLACGGTVRVFVERLE